MSVRRGWIHPGCGGAIVFLMLGQIFGMRLAFRRVVGRARYSLHGTERFNVRPEDVTIGLIAWAVGGVIGAIPAGFLGMRIGRRNAMLVGFALMAACLVALDRVTSARQATPLLALASASWALGGAVGDPLNGALFNLADGYRPLFLMMAGYSVLAMVAVLFVPRGTGEADTGRR